MGSKEIHLVKAAFHAQFKSTMGSCGVASDDYFKQVGLPVVVDDPECLLPEKPFWRLINMVALEEDIPDFGARVARTTPWHQVESLVPWIQDCDSLQGLLGTFCEDDDRRYCQTSGYVGAHLAEATRGPQFEI